MTHLRPLCRCCGKHISPVTQAFHPHHMPSYLGPSVILRDRAEAEAWAAAQGLPELIRVRMSDSSDIFPVEGGGQFVSHLIAWDGKTYRDEFFCTDRCAVAFARAVVVGQSVDYGTQAYKAAKARRDAALAAKKEA